jgi:hypothetical protein
MCYSSSEDRVERFLLGDTMHDSRNGRGAMDTAGESADAGVLVGWFMQDMVFMIL